MNIAGMGIVFARGRGVAALETSLEKGWQPPTEVEVKGAEPKRLPVYAVAAETLADKAVLTKARRADRFTRMAILAAADALADSGLGPAAADPARLGIILATGLGPHVTTFGFLDGILDFGDAAVSPTVFSHSVHNAAASYIAMTLGLRGPTLTVTDFHFAFHEAAALANLWLGEGRCDAVLVGAIDELGQVMQTACGELLTPAADGRVKPFLFKREAEAVPGEGSVFIMLTREPPPNRYGALDILPAGTLGSPAGVTHRLLEADGLIRDESGYRSAAAAGVPVGAYAPLFGSIMTGSAFHAAVAALMARRQKEFACPVPDAAADLPVIRTSRDAIVGGVESIRRDCAGACRSLLVKR